MIVVSHSKKINSRAKGARFERNLASLLREYGYDCRRGQQYCGANGDADVVGLPGLHIEAKAQETMRLYEWISQAKRDSEGTGRLPAVFHKKNHAEILVTMRLEDFMNLYREWEAGFPREEQYNPTRRDHHEQDNTGAEGT